MDSYAQSKAFAAKLLKRAQNLIVKFQEIHFVIVILSRLLSLKHREKTAHKICSFEFYANFYAQCKYLR